MKKWNLGDVTLRVPPAMLALVFVALLPALPLGAQPFAQPEFPDLPVSAAAGEGITASCLPAVAGEAMCGRFRVYEDRDAESGRTVDLAFVVLRALRDVGNTDAVTRFNGGPGAPVTPFAAPLANVLADLRAERDILLVDHRGTGNSGHLACDFPFPGGVESRFGTVFPLDHITLCRDRLSERVDLSQYTSARAMDDLAELTAWLGYAALNLVGGSYGTREVQVFLRRHPTVARTAVLNGVALVQDPLYVHHARFLHDALENLFDECEADEACARAYPDLRGVTAGVMRRARLDPPTVTAGGKAVPFGAGDLSYALRGLLYGQSGSVPALIFGAHRGDWQPLADYYLSRQAWVGSENGTATGYHFSVLCAEDIDPVTRRDIEEATRGTFMGDHLIGGYESVCDLWPSARLGVAHFAPVVSETPTLLLSGGRDPVTPPAQADALAGQLPNSVHVVVPNGGHGQGGPCVQSMIRHLVATGSTEGIDTTCVEEAPPTSFVLPRAR
jgi:pimeloyl-ACP methyl ester carboxylesterase